MKPTGSLRLLILASCVGLTACSKSGAEKAVRETLKDPDSAKFGEFYYNSATKKGCITVNAKNEMGGYTGDKQVRLTRDDHGWVAGDETEMTPEDCRTLYADRAG